MQHEIPIRIPSGCDPDLNPIRRRFPKDYGSLSIHVVSRPQSSIEVHQAGAVMSYHRVIPRDFFNEAKLLKCLGQFELCRLDKRLCGLEFTMEFDGESFDIAQDDSDGSLRCLNYRVYLNGEELELFTPYNSKENYPLMGRYRGDDYYLFDSKGKFMPNFGVRS